MYFDEEEITPKLRGTYLFDGLGNRLEKFDNNAVEVRALIEGQFLAKRAHAQRLGFTIGKLNQIYLFIIKLSIVFSRVFPKLEPNTTDCFQSEN